ncbi:MAG: type II secretion system secretin GspD [Thermodesulfobacteriota bacterium]|nr:type II secretion system secretin GspD [Thermodesulfobacteriota bacterium]
MNNKILIVFFWAVFTLVTCLMYSFPRNSVYGEEGKKTDDIGRERVTQTSKGKMITMNFDEVDIRLMVKFISELTGKNFVMDDKVKGKVTIISPTKITVEEAYKVFESVLEVHGYTTVEAGKIVKIIPSREARHRDVETQAGKDVAAVMREDRIVTQLIPLEYADANEIKKLFAPLVSKNSSIVSYTATNTIILTDVSSNIYRLIKIIKEIDIAGSAEKTTVVALEYASAQSLSSELLSLFDSKEQRRVVKKKGTQVTTAAPIKIIPDERTNSLIIRASLQTTTKIMNMIEELDKPTPRGKDRIHVFYLENASAEDLADVLSKFPSKGKGEKGRAPILGENVSIAADKSTNSLIITASPQDYTVLKEIIKKLDIMRAQVLVEALIAEVSLDKTKEFGVEWRSFEQPETGDYTFFGGTSLPIGTEGSGGIDQLIANPYGTSPSGLFLGAVKGVITFGDQEFLNLGALIRAFQSDSDINILSTPHILTMDNEEAEIIVGEERPFLTSSQTTDTGSVTNTYEYKDLGVTLRITPQISKGGMVKLNIFQEIKSFVEQIEIGAINTTKRQAKTTVIVENGEMVVIGGLIRDETRKGLSSVPCLGNIPVLGWLFKAIYQADTKTNLMVFITPHIIKSPEDLKKITVEKKEESERVKQEYQKMKDMEIKDNFKILLE